MTTLPENTPAAIDLDTLLGIDRNDPLTRLAEHLVADADQLMRSLVKHRKETCTREDVAAKLGISVEKVQEFEAYYSDPRLSEIRRYAMAIHASLATKVEPSPFHTES